MRAVLVGRGPLLAAVVRAFRDAGGALAGVIGPDPLPPGAVRLGRRQVGSRAVLFRLHRAAPDLVLVCSWFEKLPAAVLALPRLGCVNCHPSLLPAHRGPNPYLSAIVAGATSTGVTFHRMTERWDAGPILLQTPVPVGPDDTGGVLRERCAGAAAALLPELLEGLAAGRLAAVAQDEASASCFPLPGDRDLEVAWRQPARRIHDWIRGVRPWTRCHTRRGARRVYWEGSRVVSLERGAARPGQVFEGGPEPLVACGSPDASLRLTPSRGSPRLRPGDRLG